MVHPGVSVTELLPVPAVEDSELLKLLRSAGLEEWYSKFLSLGCVTIEDLRHMDERRMDEMGLRAGHRIRLDGVLPDWQRKSLSPHSLHCAKRRTASRWPN